MQIYIYPSVQFTLNKSETVTNDYSGGSCMTCKKEIFYNTDNCKEASVNETASRTNESVLTEYLYPVDYKNNVYFVNILQDRHITDIPVETVKSVTTKDGTFISDAYLTVYNSVGKPSELYTYSRSGSQGRNDFVLSNSSFGYNNYEKSVFISYNSAYNPRETIDYGLSHTVYLWGYCSKYPIAVVKGATFGQVAGVLGGTSQVDAIETGITPGITPENLHSKLSGISEATVYVYEFNPYIGMTRMIAPNGESTVYSYDSFGRLINITDHNGVTMNTYEYNYKTK